MTLKIELLQLLKDNYASLLIDEKSRDCVVIDPSEGIPVWEYLQSQDLHLKEIWNTHHHSDHIGGNDFLQKKTGAKILCSDYDRHRIPQSSYGFLDNEEHEFHHHRFRILLIPGHTLGHIAFYSLSEKLLFAGDTLFSMGCGRVFEGTYEQMFRSLQRLVELPDETQLYCGHEYTLRNLDFALHLDPSNPELLNYRDSIEGKKGAPSLPGLLLHEKKLNPFLLCRSSRDFQKLREAKDHF
jgi:hydroxyacylglutathione hydrolase